MLHMSPNKLQQQSEFQLQNLQPTYQVLFRFPTHREKVDKIEGKAW